MALPADQQATLELLLRRGQGYAELGELLGVSEPEVRERARSALEGLAGADPDRNVALTDYLLGQADPIARADVVRHLRDDPADHGLATELAAKLRELVPDAELPRLPGDPRGGRFLRRGPAGVEAAPRAAGAGEVARPAGPSSRQSRLLVALAAGAVLLIAVVLALTGAFGGDDDGTAAPTAAAGDAEVTRVALAPPGGGEGEGEAAFGLTGADTIFLDLDIAGLEPPGDEQTYVVWLLLTGERGWPLSPLPVGAEGSFQDRLAIPTGLVPLVARVRFVEVTLASNERLERMLRRAPQQARDAQDLDDFLLEVVGRTALRGAVPVDEAPAPEGQG